MARLPNPLSPRASYSSSRAISNPVIPLGISPPLPQATPPMPFLGRQRSLEQVCFYSWFSVRFGSLRAFAAARVAPPGGISATGQEQAPVKKQAPALDRGLWKTPRGTQISCTPGSS